MGTAIIPREEDMTRSEHLQWAKNRAYEYLDQEDTVQALTSFMSDMGKHDELKDHIGLVLTQRMLFQDDVSRVRGHIEKFN